MGQYCKFQVVVRMNSSKVLLVLGGTGFIGRNIVEYYASSSSYTIYAVYNHTKPPLITNVTWIQANLTDKEQVENLFRSINKIDIIIQGAATTSGINDIIGNPKMHVTDNAIMNSLILNESSKYNIEHYIFFSCTIMLAANGIKQRENDFDANAVINPSYFGAAWTKIYIEKMCEFYSITGKSKFTVIRHSNIYGKYDKFDLLRSHVCGGTITKVMRAVDHITVWGNGEEYRDLLYVKDLLMFIDKVISRQKDKFEIFNCGSGNSISINDLVDKIILISGKNISKFYDLSKPTIKNNIALNIEKSKNVLNWTPVYSLSEGLKETIEWWRSNLN